MQRRDWQLVLNACGIPFVLNTFRKREYIYVPPLLERYALKEVNGFEAELVRAEAPAPLPVHPYSGLAIFFLLPLILWHGLRFGWWPAPNFLPPPGAWLDAGVLDNVLLRVYGQFYRLATALTLHANLLHLWSNVAVGALFLPLLARVVGLGRALWLTMLGGILGNGLAALLRPRARAEHWLFHSSVRLGRNSGGLYGLPGASTAQSHAAGGCRSGTFGHAGH